MGRGETKIPVHDIFFRHIPCDGAGERAKIADVSSSFLSFSPLLVLSAFSL